MTKFTKQHYERIAQVFHESFPIKSDLETEETFKSRVRQYEKLIYEFGQMFAEDNPNFDQSRFVNWIFSDKPFKGIYQPKVKSQ